MASCKSQLPKDLQDTVFSYISDYEYLFWVDPILIGYDPMSAKDEAINVFIKDPRMVNWRLIKNKKWAIPLLEKNPHLVDWIKSNPAIEDINRVENNLLEANPEKIDWTSMLKYNPVATELLIKNPDKFNWADAYNPDVITHLVQISQNTDWLRKLNWAQLAFDPRIFVCMDKPMVRKWM